MNNILRIAVTFDNTNGEIFQHFGKTQHFKIYSTDGKGITSSEIISTDGKGHGALAPFLKALRADTVICGGLGAGMQEALTKLGIKFYAGVSGNPDDAVNKLLAGKLVYDSNPQCTHEGSNHHGM